MSFEGWDLQLGNRICSTFYNKGFISVITKAERGYGKSMYNLKTMAYCYYQVEKCTEKEAWEYALDSMIFTPEQLSRRVEDNINNDRVSLCWCIDDAAVHFSNYLFFINVFQAALMNATFDTIRTVCSCLLVNCPVKRRLFKGLQQYDDWEITIYKGSSGGYDRKAVGIKWFSLPDGKRKFRKEFEDHFSCYVPNWVYDRYMVMRKKYLKEINVELNELRVKLEAKKKKGIE